MSTHRQAKVIIQNSTGQKLLSVSVGHKYSNDYKNQKDWEGPIDDATTTADMMIVDYATGYISLGADWWLVSWVTEDGITHTTNPENMRGIIDSIESVGIKLSAPLLTLTAKLVLIPEPALTKASAAVIAALAVTSLLVGILGNSESTSGYKQHILREEDQDEPTTIILMANEVKFQSKSGVSTTGTSVLK